MAGLEAGGVDQAGGCGNRGESAGEWAGWIGWMNNQECSGVVLKLKKPSGGALGGICCYRRK